MSDQTITARDPLPHETVTADPLFSGLSVAAVMSCAWSRCGPCDPPCAGRLLHPE